MKQVETDEQKRLRQEIGTVLKSWMKANDISTTEVANRLGVSTAYVSALFAGKTIGKKVAKKLQNGYKIFAGRFRPAMIYLKTDACPRSGLFENFFARIHFGQKTLLSAPVCELSATPTMSARRADVSEE